MDELDRRIINHLHSGLTICDRPYLVAANEMGISEENLILRLSNLLEKRVLTRVGPLFQIERVGGAFTLAALHAPKEEYEVIAAKVNALPEIAHNYEREHELNMWFVIATEDPEQINAVIQVIEAKTQCKVFNFPKIKEYFVELKLRA
jgi:DNA-binding Lrp family transcriptional regulator